jgi:hypothetical protein
MDQLVVFNFTSSEDIFGCINLESSPIPVPGWYNYIYWHIYWIISATLLEGYYLLVQLIYQKVTVVIGPTNWPALVKSTEMGQETRFTPVGDLNTIRPQVSTHKLALISKFNWQWSIRYSQCIQDNPMSTIGAPLWRKWVVFWVISCNWNSDDSSKFSNAVKKYGPFSGFGN